MLKNVKDNKNINIVTGAKNVNDNKNISSVTDAKKCEWISWYKKSKVLVFDRTWRGSYRDSYCIINKNGKVVEKASYEAVDLSLYPTKKNKVKHKDKKNGLYYYSCKINGKETSYKIYKKRFKQLTKGGKVSQFKLKKNTAANRSKYLK